MACTHHNRLMTNFSALTNTHRQVPQPPPPIIENGGRIVQIDSSIVFCFLCMTFRFSGFVWFSTNVCGEVQPWDERVLRQARHHLEGGLTTTTCLALCTIQNNFDHIFPRFQVNLSHILPMFQVILIIFCQDWGAPDQTILEPAWVWLSWGQG